MKSAKEGCITKFLREGNTIIRFFPILLTARQTDAIILCYGVNDILQGRTAEQIKQDLTTIVHNLKEKFAM